MHVLAPLLSRKENSDEYITAITKGADKITLLQIIDRDFMNKTSTAMGEVMQFSNIMTQIKKKIGLKRKKCEEITEWGSTNKKILSIAIIQKADKVVLVEQKNEFFKELLAEFKKNKIKYELINIIKEK
ncbi:MAG: hypothetical protein PHX27_01910 [Candidatus ainarchaeum sp.]|nr:hypothetical protein [Candidatus ainarchaeum sp.]